MTPKKPQAQKQAPPPAGDASGTPPDRVFHPSVSQVMRLEKGQSAMFRLVEDRPAILNSLIEKSSNLSVSLDLYGISELALSILMSQINTSQAAIWMDTGIEARPPVLIRCLGIRKQWARAIGTACGWQILECLRDTPGVLRASELTDSVGPAPARIIQHAEVALFAPIIAKGRVSGIIALGRQTGGKEYSAVDLRVLNAGLGMLGVALENTSLYNRLSEKHRQLKAANEMLEETDRLKSEFLSNVNHEIRTPLTVILAYLDILLEQEKEEGSRRQFLMTISDESHKLKALLEKLLDFSAVSEQKLKLDVVAGDVAELVSAYYEERLPGVAGGLRELSLRHLSALPPARFDPLAVRQILEVLVDNAVKFTPQGSQITLTTGAVAEDGRVWGLVSVQDDGPGIPPDRLDKIFEPFRQGDGSSTRSVGGMGLGLAYARKLAEGMGGTLTVTSEPGRGAAFTLRLCTV